MNGALPELILRQRFLVVQPWQAIALSGVQRFLVVQLWQVIALSGMHRFLAYSAGRWYSVVGMGEGSGEGCASDSDVRQIGTRDA